MIGASAKAIGLYTPHIENVKRLYSTGISTALSHGRKEPFNKSAANTITSHSDSVSVCVRKWDAGRKEERDRLKHMKEGAAGNRQRNQKKHSKH